MSFPNIDYGRVVKDVVTQLVGGFQKEFLSGHPSPNTPNALAGLLGVLTGGGLTGSGTGTGTPTPAADAGGNPLGGLGDLLDNVLGGLLGNVFGALNPQAAQQTQALTASSVPASNARMVSLAADPTDPTGSRLDGENASPATETKTDPAGADAKDDTVKDGDTKDDTATDGDVKDGAVTGPAETPAAEGDTPDNAGQPKADDETPPNHAKPDDGSQPATGGTGDDATPPKHAKPDDDKQPGTDTTKDESPRKHGPKLNVVRDGANASSPQDAKPGAETAAPRPARRTPSRRALPMPPREAGPRPVARLGRRRLRC